MCVMVASFLSRRVSLLLITMPLNSAYLADIIFQCGLNGDVGCFVPREGKSMKTGKAKNPPHVVNHNEFDGAALLTLKIVFIVLPTQKYPGQHQREPSS